MSILRQTQRPVSTLSIILVATLAAALGLYVARAALTDIGFYRYVWRSEIFNAALFTVFWCVALWFLPSIE
jgi:hypothetical protein